MSLFILSVCNHEGEVLAMAGALEQFFPLAKNLALDESPGRIH